MQSGVKNSPNKIEISLSITGEIYIRGDINYDWKNEGSPSSRCKKYC